MKKIDHKKDLKKSVLTYFMIKKKNKKANITSPTNNLMLSKLFYIKTLSPANVLLVLMKLIPKSLSRFIEDFESCLSPKRYVSFPVIYVMKI